MSDQAYSQPRATIVMIARERHALTETALDSLVQNTARPYRLIYTDSQTPDWLWQKLQQRAPEWGLELMRRTGRLWPQALRNLVLDSLDTDYVVFIDNDVLVSPGWLEKLIACADETNAGIVGPLYLWGDGIKPPMIHMAGGFLKRTKTAEGEILAQLHHLENEDYAKVATQLSRKQCDNVEFHCMLVRTAALKQMGGFDENILNVHEHVDVSLAMQKLGWATYMEPAAQVNFLHFAPYRLEDLAVFRWRWAKASTEASIQAFCDKWHVLNHAQAFDHMRNFVNKVLSAGIDPLRLSAQGNPSLNMPMRREELRQTRSDLLDMAVAQGYTTQELTILANGYRFAQAFTDGGYRPCGRPFINHLVGVASILLRYGFKLDMVLTGLMHTFYSHGPPHANGTEAALQTVGTVLGGNTSPVENRVRKYTLMNGDFSEFLGRAAPDLLISEAEIFILAAAVSIEINLNGEIRYSDRSDALSAEYAKPFADVCSLLGVDGLATTFSQIDRQASVVAELGTGLKQSYRLLADKQRAVSMSNNLLAQQQKLNQRS
jgi:GT2 family glycosyltransferase